MSANSKIEWTDCTFNPWIGCTKVSPGCANCYAESRSKRTDRVEWGKGKPRRRTSANNWRQPIEWNNSGICPSCGLTFYFPRGNALPALAHQCQACRVPLRSQRVFCASLADWLDEEVPIEWLADLLALIHETPNLDWLLLTKRPENFAERINSARVKSDGPLRSWIECWQRDHPPKNVWLLVSVEDQPRANERIPILLRTPAVIRGLSCEPLLGQIKIEEYLTAYYHDGGPPHPVDWIIVGGESGPNARPCDVAWIRSIVSQCKVADVPVFVKQLGAHVVDRNDAGFEGDPGDWPMDTHTRDIDTGYQGAPVRVLLHDKKGGNPHEWQKRLRVREFPENKAVLPSARASSA